ncbi:MAG: EAL domain-containing protein, partial [Candidatus Ferrigenium altingense]
YQAKADGRNTVRFFDPAMQTAVSARVALESDLRRAVSEQEQFLLYYQPQVDSSGRMIGAEALVRWRHPERGMVSPADFIPLAEESGLILPLGHWVMATACEQLAAWAAQPEMAHLNLAVNVSAKQFNLPTFVEEVLALVDYFGVNPARLKLEITESLLLDNVNDIIAKMTALKTRGISFSMDDFGTGYSSLSYLKRLPLYQLKIDQSFVRDVLTDPNDAAIAKIIISLAKSMNLAVIAEGVETEAQRKFLELNDCHAFQGYLFSKPVPAKEFEQLIAKYA